MLVEQCSQPCALVSIVDTKQSKDTCQMSLDSSKFNPISSAISELGMPRAASSAHLRCRAVSLSNVIPHPKVVMIRGSQCPGWASGTA